MFHSRVRCGGGQTNVETSGKVKRFMSQDVGDPNPGSLVAGSGVETWGGFWEDVGRGNPEKGLLAPVRGWTGVLYLDAL